MFPSGFDPNPADWWSNFFGNMQSYDPSSTSSTPSASIGDGISSFGDSVASAAQSLAGALPSGTEVWAGVGALIIILLLVLFLLGKVEAL